MREDLHMESTCVFAFVVDMVGKGLTSARKGKDIGDESDTAEN